MERCSPEKRIVSNYQVQTPVYRKWCTGVFYIKLNCVTLIWGARGHFFWNGNKRTGLLLENKILISSGAGIMTIMDKYIEQFNSLLL